MANTKAILEQYRRDGFVVVDNVLSKRQLDDFLGDEPRIPPWGKGPQPLQRFRVEPHWRRLVSNRRIVRTLTLLMGLPPRVVEAIYIPKPPAPRGCAAGSGVAFHRDIDHIRTEPATLIGCWIALNDTALENGGLCVVPGSHAAEPALSTRRRLRSKATIIENRMRDRDGRLWVERLDPSKFDHLNPAQILSLTVPAGSVVFFHGSLVHGSFSNLSPDRDRLVASVHYVAEGSWVFRTDIQDTVSLAGMV